MRAVFRLLSLCCAVVMPLGLSACGFVPLYAQQGLTRSLSHIAIETPQTRTGYFLEQQLRNGLAEDSKAQKLYGLTVTLDEHHYQVGFRVDDTSTRSELTDSVSYTLTERSTGKVLLQKSFVETVTYNSSDSPFTGIVSQQDAQERVALSASQKIQTDLALYFHNRP